MTGAVLAIDQGTTATKAMIVGPSGAVVGFASVPVKRHYPRPGWVEQDPVELWQSVIRAVEQLPKVALSCVGVSSQRESVLIWDRTGRPLTPCVSWQCNRGAQLCRYLRASGAGPLVRELTGLPLDPMFSAAKLRHLLDTDPSVRRAAGSGEVCAGTIDSWLAWNLSGCELHITDAGNASRTLLFDIQHLAWSPQLLEIFGLPEAFLPKVVPSAGILGETVAQGPLPKVPLASLMADSHAALYGLGCLKPGTAKATYGTGTSLASPTGPEPARSDNGLATSVAWLRALPTFTLEGNVFSSGATVEWVAKLLGLEDAAAVEQLALTVPSAGGVHVVPGFAGLGAPHWSPEARGQIGGLTFASGAGEVARAAIESIAFQVSDLVAALEKDIGRGLEELHVDGGATRNDLLMQLQADLVGCPVVRSSTPDASAFGAALLAGLATGLFASEEQVANIGRQGHTMEPTMSEEDRNELLAAWRDAVSRTIATEPSLVAH
ncbi:MAG TPA: FGGY family carbohydrate kinase [Acidimicrobiales bacterium]|nr:FGGY family carbohydrate kinase [Acidimicrobiales bacterium]